MRPFSLARHWRIALVVVALLAATAGGAGAKAAFDANNARRVGGYTHGQLATMSIPPQAAFVGGGASQGVDGPTLFAHNDGQLTVSFVVPPNHDPAKPLRMRLSYLENGSASCGWVVSTAGLQGPDAPNTEPNVHNGAWNLPGGGGFNGTMTVPAGPGSAHVAVFTWPFDDKPGMFVQFTLHRQGAAAADTCGPVTVVGLRLVY